MLARLYRAVVPRTVRTPLLHLRSALRPPAGGNGRGSLFDFYRSLGFKTWNVRLRSGVRMTVDLRDYAVGFWLFVHNEYEPAETAFLERNLRAGDTFLDVGGNIGYFSVHASSWVGPTGRVLAVEPDPWNRQLLDRNLATNRATNVTVLPVAVGAEAGTVKLYKSVENYGDHRLTDDGTGRASVEVQLRRLDDVLDDAGVKRVDVLKVDVQGHEAHMFRGAERLLAEPPRVILMEYWPAGITLAGEDPDRMLVRLLDAGYKLAVLEGDGRTTPTDRAGLADRLAAMPPGPPDSYYVNLALVRTGSDDVGDRTS